MRREWREVPAAGSAGEGLRVSAMLVEGSEREMMDVLVQSSMLTGDRKFMIT